MNYFILAILWIAYCTLHSALITPRVTKYIKRQLGESYRFYRLFYNAFAVITLGPVVFYTYSIRQIPFFTWDGYLLPVRLLMIAAGLFLFYVGSKQYDMSTFMGLRQIMESENHILINSTGKLNSNGILGVVRHHSMLPFSH